MNKAVLLIGGNINNRLDYLIQCMELIKSKIGSIKMSSQIYETAAWGVTDQNDFLNQAIIVDTNLSPQNLLVICLEIEKELGRERKVRWGERTVDVDIIFYNQLIIETDHLIIPHPRYHQRNFVLNPLNEIIPDFICPSLKKSISEIFEKCKDEGKCEVFKG